MTIRPCLSSDLPLDGAPWLEPDTEIGESRSLVDEVDGRVVAAGLRLRSRKSDRDMVELACDPGQGTELLRALITDDERPVMLRVVPGTSKADAVAALGGGEVLQSLPPAAVPSGHPDVQDWARQRLAAAERAGVELRPGAEHTLDELLDLWMQAYLPMHESWAPVTDVAATREMFRTAFTESLNTAATFVAHTDGHALAATLTTAELDGIPVPCMIELAPGHTAVEAGAAASMAAVLMALSPRSVEFEGHVDEPLYMRILQTIPHTGAGALTPMDLVRMQGRELSPARSG